MKESEIRPQNLFDEFLEIAKQDAVSFFSKRKSFVNIICCPVCNRKNNPVAFRKERFDYRECLKCGTLYVSPRPTKKMMQEFYRKSQSSKFLAEKFYKATENARREKIFRPRAIEISDIVKEYCESSKRFVDIGSGYGTFLEEIKSQELFSEIYGIEPSPHLADVCRSKGFEIIESTLENMKVENSFDFATSFELLEHVYSPEEFLLAVNKILIKKGILYLTTLNCKGFDLLILRENSKSISPPHHINFINPGSLKMLLLKTGFEIIDISKPCKIDIDIVLNYAKEDEIECDNFTKYLLFETDEKVKENFQRFLQKNRLSSHIRVIARKTADK